MQLDADNNEEWGWSQKINEQLSGVNGFQSQVQEPEIQR